jgi:hypothetical protein
MHVKIPTDHDLVAMPSPFAKLITLTIKIHCDEPSIGIVIEACAA